MHALGLWICKKMLKAKREGSDSDSMVGQFDSMVGYNNQKTPQITNFRIWFHMCLVNIVYLFSRFSNNKLLYMFQYSLYIYICCIYL